MYRDVYMFLLTYFLCVYIYIIREEERGREAQCTESGRWALTWEGVSEPF